MNLKMMMIYMKLQKKHYGLIYCIELLAIEGRQKEWESCFDSLGLPEKHILDCFNSGKGTTVGFFFPVSSPTKMINIDFDMIN